MKIIFSNNYVNYIPKPKGSFKPWLKFGSNKTEYFLWYPHICGICNLAMVLSSYDIAYGSLYKLTSKCCKYGGFKIKGDGSIEGIFHYPLLETAKSFGLNGEVIKDLDVETMLGQIKNGRFVIFSINLAKFSSTHKGGHLILGFKATKHENIIVHDPSSVLQIPGNNVLLSKKEIEYISNNKGIVLWK